MDQNQAIAILIQVAHQALGAGLFKTFEDTKVVSEAVEAFKQEQASAEAAPLKVEE